MIAVRKFVVRVHLAKHRVDVARFFHVNKTIVGGVKLFDPPRIFTDRVPLPRPAIARFRSLRTFRSGIIVRTRFAHISEICVARANKNGTSESLDFQQPKRSDSAAGVADYDRPRAVLGAATLVEQER